jgi:hypothetical protein
MPFADVAEMLLLGGVGARARWYVAWLRGQDTFMHLAVGRERAIADACDMLERGIDERELGPMIETAVDRISATAIREIFERRRAV